jgi:Protein of unknown function (DUF3551)
MEVTMRVMLVMAAAAATVFLDVSPANAVYQGPWCAVQTLGLGSAAWDCRMRTFEECRLEVVAGNRGHCTQNPNWPGWYGPAAAVDAPQPVRRRRAR